MEEKCPTHPSRPADDCLECERKAQRLVPLAPGLASHIADWTMDDGEPMLRGHITGSHMLPSENAPYDFYHAAEIAGYVAERAARTVAERLEEREQRIAFATVFTKVFDRAFDAAFAEIVNEELRQRGAA